MIYNQTLTGTRHWTRRSSKQALAKKDISCQFWYPLLLPLENSTVMFPDNIKVVEHNGKRIGVLDNSPKACAVETTRSFTTAQVNEVQSWASELCGTWGTESEELSNQRVRCVFFWKNIQVAAQYTEKQKGPPHFIVKLFENKGRGIVAQKDFSNGEFLVEYPGELITAEEGNLREEEESSGFLFFKHQGQSYCLDATDECAFADRLGHLMNHGQGMEENAQVKILDLKSHPHMCIFASKNISKGTEVQLWYSRPAVFSLWRNGFQRWKRKLIF